jgi:hypothetical protein
VRGEAGTLVVSLGNLARLRSNPFFAVIRDRIVGAIAADRQTGAPDTPAGTPQEGTRP